VIENVMSNHPSTPNPNPDALESLGPYDLVKVIGKGSMGVVYLGRHRVLEIEHAIKVLPSEFASDAMWVQRFLREARQSARLNHPHIVRVVGAGEVRNQYYLAMEFIEGQALDLSLRHI